MLLNRLNNYYTMCQVATKMNLADQAQLIALHQKRHKNVVEKLEIIKKE